MHVMLTRESKQWWPSLGSWTFFRLGGLPSARISCIKCGAVGTLADHSIDGEGKVTPSVDCPEECGWHVNVTLRGWAQAIAERGGSTT